MATGEDINKKIWDIATKNFHTWQGLLASSIGLWILALSIFKLLEGHVSFQMYVMAVAMVNVLIGACWIHYKYAYPKRPKERIGIVIAINATETEDRRLIEEDFISPLEQKLAANNLPCAVIRLKEHQVHQVRTSNDSLHVLRKTEAQLCFWGTVKRRGSEYIFAVNGMVVHSPVQVAQKILLERDFKSLLPDELKFERDAQFSNFVFRSDQLLLAIEYIAGKAAALSGDCEAAIILHEAVYKAVSTGATTAISRTRIMKDLASEYDTLATVEYLRSGLLNNNPGLIQKILTYDPKNYGGLLKKAVSEFDRGNGDAMKALETVKEAEVSALGGQQWLYSSAFLKFWLERYGEALQDCERLKEKDYPGERSTATEVVAFNESLIKTHHKIQLYYWLGFIYLNKLDNPGQADKYFQKFINESNKSTSRLNKSARKYLEKIRKTIGYQVTSTVEH